MARFDFGGRMARVNVVDAGNRFADFLTTDPAIQYLLGVNPAARAFIRRRPSGLRLLLLILVTDMVFFLCFSVKLAALPIRPLDHMFDGTLRVSLGLALVGRTVFLYALAGLLGSIGRRAGGTGSARDTLAGLVWATIAAVPIAIGLALLAVFIAALQAAFPVFDAKWLAVLPHWMSIITFVWLTAVGVASAHGVTRLAPFLAPASVVTCVAVFGATVALAAIAWL